MGKRATKVLQKRRAPEKIYVPSVVRQFIEGATYIPAIEREQLIHQLERAKAHYQATVRSVHLTLLELRQRYADRKTALYDGPRQRAAAKARIRDQQVLAVCSEGLSYAEVGKRFNITRQRVGQIVKRSAERSTQ